MVASRSLHGRRQTPKSNIDKKKMKEDFHRVAKELTSLEETFESTTSNDAGMKEMFQRIGSTMLQLAASSDLGKYGSTVGLQKSPDNSRCDANETACDEQLKKPDILALLGGHGYNEDNSRVDFVPLDIVLLKKAMGWNQNDRIDVEDDNFIFLKTTDVQSIWRTYNKKGKAGPRWGQTLVEAIRQCESRGWSSSLSVGPKPS